MLGFFLDAANPTNLHLIHLGRQEILKFKTSITPRCQHRKSLAWLSFSYVTPKIDGWNPEKIMVRVDVFPFPIRPFFRFQLLILQGVC